MRERQEEINKEPGRRATGGFRSLCHPPRDGAEAGRVGYPPTTGERAKWLRAQTRDNIHTHTDTHRQARGEIDRVMAAAGMGKGWRWMGGGGGGGDGGRGERARGCRGAEGTLSPSSFLSPLG